MTDDRIARIEALLDQAKDAHGVYEEAELGGAYDEQWPAWYARYAVDNGLVEIMARPLDADSVAAFFTGGWDEFRALDPKPEESWSTWTARRIAKDL